ncbi:hypothetical protein H0H81_007860, partial [Sphagnurus paluster]
AIEQFLAENEDLSHLQLTIEEWAAFRQLYRRAWRLAATQLDGTDILNAGYY